MISQVRLLQDEEEFQRLDSQGMLELLCEFPMQCESAWNLSEGFPISHFSFQNVLFLGMGGSAIGGDLVRSLLEEEAHFPILVNRSYHLPAFVNSKSLVFAVSYSGNTEETLTAYQAARQKRARVVAIASGGKLLDWARRDKIPYLEVPSGLPPRTALGYLFFVPYVILRRLSRLSLRKQEFEELIRTLNRFREMDIGPEVPFSKNSAKRLALRLVNRIPAIHGNVQRIDAVVTRWRTQLAENSKQLSWTHLYPELNHNEIVGWRKPDALLKHLLILLLRDREDHGRVKLRMEITKTLIHKEEGVETIEIWSQGRGRLSRLFSLIYLGDFVSYYLAILNRVDPTPVERIERLKARLARR